MTKKIKIPAILLYFIGIFFVSFGIPLMIKANLGITVVTSFPYAVSVITGLFSVGMWVTIVQCAVLLLAIIILKRITISMLASFITAYLLGAIIDLMTLVFANLVFDTLALRIIIVVVSSCITGIGAGTLVFSSYPPIPDLVFMRDIGKAKNIGLTKMKLMFDGVFLIMTVALTLIVLRHIIGVGIGTVISLLIIGVFVGQTNTLLTKTVKRVHFFGEEKEHRFFEYNILSLLKSKKTTD